MKWNREKRLRNCVVDAALATQLAGRGCGKGAMIAPEHWWEASVFGEPGGRVSHSRNFEKFQPVSLRFLELEKDWVGLLCTSS